LGGSVKLFCEIRKDIITYVFMISFWKLLRLNKFADFWGKAL